MQIFLLLLFLLLHGAMAASVPGCHGDRDKDHRPRENCSRAGFSHVPAGLDQQTQVLLFPSNLFSSLSWSSFQEFPGLYELDLTANQVPAVAPSSAPVLAGLAVLRLGSNLLTFLPDGAFAACPALTELYLQNNSLASLTDQSFSGLSVLEILDLTANRISILPALMLHPLTAIETLYLENNQIQVMPDGWFSQKEDVPYLYLSLNPWACSCSLGYLRRYLDDFELNIYVRDGADIRTDVDSVVCDSPRRHQGKPVVTLEESDLCSADREPEPPGDVYQPVTSLPPDPTAPAALVQPSSPEPPAETSPPQPMTPDLTTMSAERASVRHRVTQFWYRTFTSPKQRSHHSSSETQTGSSSVGWFNGTAHPTTEVPPTTEKLYKPLMLTLARRAKVREGAALLRKEEQAEGGVVALYRSLLFVHREGGGAAGREEGGGQTVTLKLAGDGTGGEDRGVYRRSMYRLVSREEELEGWREVLEECRAGRGAEEGQRSSWGEWLAGYLPSMPWGLAAPPEEAAAAKVQRSGRPGSDRTPRGSGTPPSPTCSWKLRPTGFQQAEVRAGPEQLRFGKVLLPVSMVT
ncbi:hypothetical protein CCH79_00019709, partial [Gambusia affinis]